MRTFRAAVGRSATWSKSSPPAKAWESSACACRCWWRCVGTVGGPPSWHRLTFPMHPPYSGRDCLWTRSFGLMQLVKRMPVGRRSSSCATDKPARCCFGQPSTTKGCCVGYNWRQKPAMPSPFSTDRRRHFARPLRPPYVSLSTQTETTLAPSSSKFAADIPAASPCL